MFKIQKWNINNKENSIDFHFECDVYGAFRETITFPEKADISKYSNDSILHRLLDIMAAYLGVSYYKLSATDTIKFELSFSDITQKSIEKLYIDGLGEFYIRNELKYPPNISFNYSDNNKIQSSSIPEDTLKSINCTTATVAFGGGKDSHVTISLLEKLKIAQDVVSVVLADTVKETLKKLSYTEITFIKRKIDSKLITLVKEGKGYNGHIPITAINSIILSAYSYLTGNNWVVFSNERGASVPTIFHDTYKINHQYSKSTEFEELFRNTLNDICGDKVQYFSMLRPFSELWIAAYLGHEAKAAHSCFSSCNRNFVFEGKNKLPADKRWCGECSKCIYTAIITAPHISKKEFMNIFADNILNQPSNIKIAADLCGIGESKPWECVGDFADTASSLLSLTYKKEWQEDALPKELEEKLKTKYGEVYLKERFISELSSRSVHFLPNQISSITTSPYLKS